MSSQIPPIMPFIVLILFLLPIKLAPKQLMSLAFALWMTGGLFLAISGGLIFQHLLQEAPVLMEPTTAAIFIVSALIIGIGKGKFVLSKTSQRNIDRLSQMQEPQRPIHVYSVRSWVMITLMVLISMSLTWFDAPLEWRAAVRLAVGFALIMSSLNYLKAPRMTASIAP